MESLQRSPNASFASPNKDSPSKKTLSPGDTFNGKKGFLSTLFNKKKASNGFDIEMPAKPNVNEAQPRAKLTKQKAVNRKNIADGRIRLNVIENDRVPEDYNIDYRDNIFDTLDQNPLRTTSYIENLRSRDFSQVNNREVRRFIENQQQKDITPPIYAENLELDLLELSKTYENILSKFFRFFQGLLAGFCIIHLFLIFADSTDQNILGSYVLGALRIDQIIYVVALLSVLGSLTRYMETNNKYADAIRSQSPLKETLSRQATKYLIASLCFLVVYGITIYNHEFVAKISDKASAVNIDDFDDKWNLFRALSVIKAVLAVVGWITLVLAFEEVSQHQVDMIEYSDLTGDESLDESA
jgi:hypothetical protein